MVPMKRIAFSALLDWFVEIDAKRWNVYVQGTQFDVKEYASAVQLHSGMLLLNLSANATRNFTCDDEGFSFKSRINGVEVFLEIPYTAVFAAVHPDTGIPNMYPFFEDYGDMDPIETVDVLGTPVAKYNVVTLPHSEISRSFELNLNKELQQLLKDNPNMSVIFSPSDDVNNDATCVLGKLGHYNDGQLGTGPMASIGSPATVEPTPVEPTVEERVTQRRWRVIEGGKQKVEATMPWIDEVYRAKRDRREAAQADKFIIGNSIPHVPDGKEFKAIRSDGNDGTSSFFPDLDVAKCVFYVKPTPRPEWMTVLEGGK